jgi:hypothetical protein
MVRELGFALNRLNRREEAEATLRAVINEHGASSETNGLLGRVYKDRWEEAVRRQVEARRWLRKAIENLFGRIHGRHSRCVSGRECGDVEGNG